MVWAMTQALFFRNCAPVWMSMAAATSHILANLPRVTALRLAVAQRPRVSLLDSDRRVPFNEIDIFRRYLDLDE